MNVEVIQPRAAHAPGRKSGRPCRASGALSVSCKQRGDRSVIADFRQRGSLKALFPRPQTDALDMVLLNTAGGITGGDRFDTAIAAGGQTTMTVSTQAAERIYKTATEEVGQARVALTLGAGARLNWVPQETILFDRARLERRLTVEMDETATLLLVEPIVFGRRAMGEEVSQVLFRDIWRVRRGGRRVFADNTALIGNCADMLDRPGVAGGARAMASMALVSPEADRHLGTLRNLLPLSGGASLPEPGVLHARILAKDGFALRRSLVPLIERLMNQHLPKVWML